MDDTKQSSQVENAYIVRFHPKEKFDNREN